CPGHEPRHRARGHHDRRCRHPADRDSPLRPGFIRRAQSSTIARPGPCPSARRDEENPTMDINRTTVPGTGSLHHFTTRADRRFAVLAHPDGRRTLIIYHDGPPDSNDPDAPAQHIELDVDEADQLAEVLHSRSLLDRIARLEHRL